MEVEQAPSRALKVEVVVVVLAVLAAILEAWVCHYLHPMRMVVLVVEAPKPPTVVVPVWELDTDLMVLPGWPEWVGTVFYRTSCNHD